MSKILIVDDEPRVLAAFEEMLAAEGHQVLTANRAETALARFHAESPELVILDIRMPGMNGLDALQAIKQHDAKLPVIIMTGQGTMLTAIEATKRGAFDYHLKPFDPEAMLETIIKALDGVRLMQRHVLLASQSPASGQDAIVGNSPQMQQVYKAIGRVAATDASVLIRGESGTGKELVARAIYQHSRRCAAPMLILNCTAIPNSLLESELFGHERGAFTGAVNRRIGKFEQAHGGTLFFDEIGDIPLDVQAKILRVLQDKDFQRVGGNETIIANVRILAATNRELERAMAEGRFREDLYHRLNVVTIHLPSLRQRQSDVPLLVEYFLERFSQELKIDKPPLSDEALQLLVQHAWPGNVRELEHCLQRTIIFTQGHSIQAADLQLQHYEGASPGLQPAHVSSGSGLSHQVHQFLDSYHGSRAHAEFLDAAETLLLTEALRRTRGNQSQAARLLGLSRPTLHAKIQKLGIRTDTDPNAPDSNG